MDRLYERENVEVEMCRLCFTLALSQQAITNSPYAQEFNNFKFIELQIGFELPANICGQCLVQLNQLGSYLKMCKDAYNTYKLMKPSPQKPPPNPELTSDIKQEAVESESEEIFETSIDIADESEKLFAKFSEEDPFFETITQPQIAKVEIDCDDTSSDPFYCEDTNMEEMMNKETSSQTRTCPTCGVNVTTLASHYSKNPKCGPRNSHCPTCNLYFGNKHRLLHHQKTHHPEEVSTTSLMCHICLKAFQYADSLSQHLQTHENDQQDGCDQSGNVCSTSTSNMLQGPSSEVAEEARYAVDRLLPTKSVGVYQAAYQRFIDWCAERNVTDYSEDILLAYFCEMRSKLEMKSSTLWTHYSRIKPLLNINHRVDMGKHFKLLAYLKKQGKTYVANEVRTLTKEQFDKFFCDAPDDHYLAIKVILIFGISGACRRYELVKMKVDDIQDLGTLLFIKIPDSTTNKTRSFTIVGDEYINTYRKYASLRPPHLNERRFFLKYRNGVCCRMVMGKNNIGNAVKAVASYLQLPDWKKYTGHCLRRSSPSLLEDAEADDVNRYIRGKNSQPPHQNDTFNPNNTLNKLPTR